MGYVHVSYNSTAWSLAGSVNIHIYIRSKYYQYTHNRCGLAGFIELILKSWSVYSFRSRIFCTIVIMSPPSALDRGNRDGAQGRDSRCKSLLDQSGIRTDIVSGTTLKLMLEGFHRIFGTSIKGNHWKVKQIFENISVSGFAADKTWVLLLVSHDFLGNNNYSIFKTLFSLVLIHAPHKVAGIFLSSLSIYFQLNIESQLMFHVRKLSFTFADSQLYSGLDFVIICLPRSTDPTRNFCVYVLLETKNSHVMYSS